MSSPASAPDQRRLAWLAGVLVVVLAYWNARGVLGFELLGWDDDINITFNSFLGELSWERLKWMFADASYMRRYVPLGWLGLSGVYGLSGLAPEGYHFANLLLHAVNSGLLFLLTQQLLRRWSEAADDRWRTLCAAVAAGLWAWHPFRAETVGWASGLLYSWATFWALLAVLVYSGGERGGFARWRVRVAAGLYLASILAYPIALGCLGIFLLIDVLDGQQARHPGSEAWWRDPSWRRRFFEKLFFVIPALVVTAGNVVARYESSEFWAKAPGLGELSFFSRVMRSVYTLAYYSVKPWWPVDLTPAPTQLMKFDPLSPAPVLAAFFLVIVTVALWAWPAGRRGALGAWLAYLAFYVPMLGVTEQLYFPCDRYGHLPLMVASVAGGLLLARVPATGRRLVVVGAAIVIGVLGYWQRAQFEVWRNTGTVLQRIIDRTENRDYAAFLTERWVKFHAQRSEFAAAQTVLAAGRARFPGDPALDRAEADLARYRDLQRGLNENQPNSEGLISAAQLHHQVAMAFVRKGEWREAREHFSAALTLEPAYAAARFNFAVLWALQGEAPEALRHYLAVERLEGVAVAPAARRRVLTLLAGAYDRSGRTDLAARCLERALREAGPEAESASLRSQLEAYRRTPAARG